jgi:hypothetical protein
MNANQITATDSNGGNKRVEIIRPKQYISFGRKGRGILVRRMDDGMEYYAEVAALWDFEPKDAILSQ